VLSELAAELASEVDYPNFKSAAHQRAEGNKNHPYSEIWSIMHAVQIDESRHI
jgi:hypothetical protein